MTGIMVLLSWYDMPIPQEPGVIDNLSQLRIAFSAAGVFSVTSNGPHPLPASINQPPKQQSFDLASQLFPTSLFTIANSFLSASCLRWRVFVSPKKATPSLFTEHKTSNRWQYNNALALIPPHPAELVHNGVSLQTEVLIINDSGEIMEGCRFTPYFLRESQWITPSASCGGNLGTTRRWALANRRCVPGVVTGASVTNGEIIVLSNGAKGFQTGIVQPWTSLSPAGAVIS